MTPKQKRRLTLVTLVLLGTAGCVALLIKAIGEPNLFVTPAQISAGEVPEGRLIRIGGMVQENSFKRSDTDLTVHFLLGDGINEIPIQYTGILPDLFREGQGVVIEGKMTNQQFIADEIFAKHDETYMPPEVLEAMEAAHKNAEATPSTY